MKHHEICIFVLQKFYKHNNLIVQFIQPFSSVIIRKEMESLFLIGLHYHIVY